MCDGQMNLIVFITQSAEIGDILNHIGLESVPPHISPARGQPLWESCDAPVDDGVQGEPEWDLVAQPAQDYDVGQSVNWRRAKEAFLIDCGTTVRKRQTQMHLSFKGLVIEQ